MVALENGGGAGKAGALVGLAYRRLASPDVLEAIDVVERILKRHAIGKQAHVLLELLQRSFGMRAKVAVCLAAREAECIERVLQRLDIGTVEIGKTQVQGAVAQAIRGVYKRAPARRIDALAGIKAVAHTEHANGHGGRGAKIMGFELSLFNGIAKSRKTRLHVLHRGTLHSSGNRLHVAPSIQHRRCPIRACGHTEGMLMNPINIRHAPRYNGPTPQVRKSFHRTQAKS